MVYLDVKKSYDLAGLGDLAGSNETFATCVSHLDDQRLSMDIENLVIPEEQNMQDDNNGNNSNSDIPTLPPEGTTISLQPGHVNLDYQPSDSDDGSVESFNTIQSEPEESVVEFPAAENGDTVSVEDGAGDTGTLKPGNNLQQPLEPEVIVTNTSNESDDETNDDIYMANEANDTIVSSAATEEIEAPSSDTINSVPSDGKQTQPSEEENSNTLTPSCKLTSNKSQIENDDENGNTNNAKPVATVDRTDKDNGEDSPSDSDSEFKFDQESIEEGDVEEFNGLLLTPDGLEPIKPPPGISPGLPHHIGRLRIKQAKRKGKKQ